MLEVAPTALVQRLRLSAHGLGLEPQVVRLLACRLPGLAGLLEPLAMLLASSHPGLALLAQSLHLLGGLLPAAARPRQHFALRLELGLHVLALGAYRRGALASLLVAGGGGGELGLERRARA